MPHCRYPTNVNNASSSELSYCTIYGKGLPDTGMPSKEFMNDCVAQESLMVGDTPRCPEGGKHVPCRPAAQFDVPFYQLFVAKPPIAYAGTESEAQDSELLPSRENEFEANARLVAAHHAASKGVMPPVMDPLSPPDCKANKQDGPCTYQAGSMIEAIHEYASDCEENDDMRVATLLVSALFILNLVELLMLLQVSL